MYPDDMAPGDHLHPNQTGYEKMANVWLNALHTFLPLQTTRSLTVQKPGTGEGTITSLPTAINCGSNCSASFSYGTVITLTATANPSSTFTSWTGCDSVSGNVCTVTMNANITVTAMFTIPHDFNKDGNPDILWRHTTDGGEVVVWNMDGINLIGSVYLGGVAEQSWTIVGVGDFNHDGNPDILWRHTTDGGEVVVWNMDGINLIGSVYLGGVAEQSWTIVGVGDFNHDGNPDILWRHTTGDNELAVWFMDGINLIGSAGIGWSVADQSWAIVGVGDFNHDGNPDILWRNTSEGWNAVWYMDGVNPFESVYLYTVAEQSWTIVGVGDFNHDGNPDILWRHTTDGGEVVVWYMDGINLIGSVYLGGVAEQSWQIVGH